MDHFRPDQEPGRRDISRSEAQRGNDKQASLEPQLGTWPWEMPWQVVSKLRVETNAVKTPKWRSHNIAHMG